MKYNKEAVEAYIKNDIKKLEEYTAKKEPIIVILGHIQRGNFYNHACQLARVSVTQFDVWKRRKASFALAVDLADAKAIDELRGIIKEHATNEWTAARYLLSVKDRRYRESSEVDVEGRLEMVHIYKPKVENK